jgi:sulfite exporter TauE/SafE
MGMLVMGVFGLGTVPLMLVTGITASLLTLVQRRWLMYAAAWSVVLTGCITVARGAGVLDLQPGRGIVRCPFCSYAEQPAEVRPK